MRHHFFQNHFQKLFILVFFCSVLTLNAASIAAQGDGAVSNEMKTLEVSGEMPALPQFPALVPKPGRARGCVKNWTGKSLLHRMERLKPSCC